MRCASPSRYRGAPRGGSLGSSGHGETGMSGVRTRYYK